MVDLRQAQDVAVDAARRAGEIIRQGMATARLSVCRVKAVGDVATFVDAAAERIIRERLLAAYPDHAFVGEEQGAHGTSPCRWIVDPLDGTMNFVHGLPYFAVSVALEVEGKVRLAVVHDPVGGDVYAAREGRGAWRNGERLRVADTADLGQALVGAATPPPAWPDMADFLRRFGALCRNAAGVRRLGAAALDLAGVASGRLDGFFMMHLALWDVAAGGLLVTEAGGCVVPLPGVREEERAVRVVAACPGIVAALLRVLA